MPIVCVSDISDAYPGMSVTAKYSHARQNLGCIGPSPKQDMPFTSLKVSPLVGQHVGLSPPCQSVVMQRAELFVDLCLGRKC
eukprot:3809886-Amphidinium_carterae.2